MTLRFLYLLLLLILPIGSQSLASPLGDTVQQLNLELLQGTFAKDKVNRLLGNHGGDLSDTDRKAAAVLIAHGVIRTADLNDAATLADRLLRHIEIVQRGHPALMGRLDDAVLSMRIPSAWDHDELLAQELFLNVLGEKLSDGIITGYDLRRKGVYDGLPAGHTFIYSQSSMLHMQQLTTLLSSEGIDGWIYITPKVSAFLYRDDWGPASPDVKTLASGVRVVQGREIAAMFEFDSPKDRSRFHEVITRYAKKDAKDEQGLIANAWWQPFYYTDTVLEGFKPISLVIVAAGDYEATLTVLEARAASVVDALDDFGWQVRVDRVWVNPAFYRFLGGDYK